MAYAITYFVDAIGVSSTCIYNDELDLPSVVTIDDQIVGGWKETLPSVVTITDSIISTTYFDDEIGVSSEMDIDLGITLNSIVAITDEITTTYLDEVLPSVITIVDELFGAGLVDSKEGWTKQSASQTTWNKQ